MIKIGDFAKLANVTIKTLHHYDQLGLIKPVHVDRFSGYRYYALDQLSILNRILALKDLGFSLEQVDQLLNEDISTQEMRGMLKMKKFELLERVYDEQTRLSRVETRLRQLETENCSENLEVAVKNVPSMTIMTIAQVYDSYGKYLNERNSLVNQLSDALTDAGLKPAGPYLTLMGRLPKKDYTTSLELGVPIPLRKSQRQSDWRGSTLNIIELPAEEEMASIIHPGQIDTLPNTYKRIYGWSLQHSYRIAGLCREIYHADPGEEPESIHKVPVPISLRSLIKDNIMEPKFVTRPAFNVVGLSYVGKNENQEIAQMWNVFNQRDDEIKAIDRSQAYGLCFDAIDHPDEAYFEYVSGREVANDQDIPEGMVYREISEHRYAVFTHEGTLDNLSETYSYIYETWLPQSGYELDGGFDMEVYDKDFMFNHPDSKFYIYTAIK